MEVQLPSFVTSALDGVIGQVYALIVLCLGKNFPVQTEREAGWVQNMSGSLGEEKIVCSCKEPNPDSTVVQSIA